MSDWHDQRKRGIGGSDAPAICGVSPWKSPYQVWLEKRGEAEPQEDNEPMFWGRTLEPVIRQRYADVTGRQVMLPNTILRHPNIEWMLANVDGIADGGRVLEVKTARSPDGWGEPGSAEIPEPYIIQVQHYMVVTHLPVADVAALIGGNDFRIYEVPADPELQQLILDREAAFWEMVMNGTPPDPTTYSDVRHRFGRTSKALKIQATDMVIAAIRRLKEIKSLSEEEEKLKTLVMAYMEENDTLVDNENVLATWRMSKAAKRFDAKALQETHPDIYKEFLKEGEPSRRLLIK